MARRNRDLAGLAALGALGYALTRGDTPRTDGGAPVEDRNAPVGVGMSKSAESEYTGRPGKSRYVVNEIGDLVEIPEGPSAIRPAAPASAPVRSMTPASRSTKPKESAESETRGSMAARRNVAGDYTRKMGPTAEEIAAYSRAQEAKTVPVTATPAARAVETSTEAETPKRRMSPRPNTSYTHQLEAVRARKAAEAEAGMKKGGAVKKMASGGMTASKRADGIAQRGKTKGRMV